MGFEPMNTGFADQRVSHFAIGAHCCQLVDQARHTVSVLPLFLITAEDNADASLHITYSELLCYRKVFLRQIPALHIESGSRAIGAFGGIFYC